MEKTKYYVTVGSSPQILADKTVSSFEFEIEATQDQITKLQEMFNQSESFDNDVFWRTHIPYVPYHDDDPNDQYDHQLIEIYRFLHELGTVETKHTIEEMGILGKDTLY